MHHTIAKRVKCLRLSSRLPSEFCAEAIEIIVYLINRSPNSTLDAKVTEEVSDGYFMAYEPITFLCI